MTDLTPKKTAKPALHFDEDQLREVIDELRSRSEKHEITAKNYAITIGISMIFGFGVFVFAGEIAAIDEIDFYNESRGISIKLATAQATLNTIEKKLDEKDVKSPPVSDQIQPVLKDIMAATEATKRLESSYRPDQKEIELIHQRHLISTVTTRVSAASLLAFLVAILANLYRHNIRLAAFYTSRHNAMRLSKTAGLSAFEKASKLLFPDGLEIGKIPNTPTEQLIGFAKKILKTSSSNANQAQKHS